MNARISEYKRHTIEVRPTLNHDARGHRFPLLHDVYVDGLRRSSGFLQDREAELFARCIRRARELHDQTLLEIRRQVIGERRLAPIRPRHIARTRLASLEKFAPLLNGEEFTQLCVLLRNLPPATVYLMRPENTLKIMRGDPEAARQSLRLVLDGDPATKPLFVA
jgi:hypothetical protein